MACPTERKGQCHSLTQLYGDFIEYAKGEQGLTRQTTYTYRPWLNSFLRWLDASGHPDSLDSLTTPILRTYVYSLSKRGLRPRAVRSAFLPIKSMATFLVSHGVLTQNPCTGIGLPKKDAALRATVTNEEAIALMEGAVRMFPERRRLLAEAMIANLTMTGMRFSEWIDLRVQDVCLGDNSLLVASGKGRKSRTLWPPPEALGAVRAWPTERASMHCSHDWLWAEHKSRRVGNDGARRLLDAVKACAGLSDHANILPHSPARATAGPPTPSWPRALGWSRGTCRACCPCLRAKS